MEPHNTIDITNYKEDKEIAQLLDYIKEINQYKVPDEGVRVLLTNIKK